MGVEMAVRAVRRPKKAERGSERSLAQLQKWNEADLNRWSLRNERFQRHQNLYRLTKPDAVESRLSKDIIIPPDPKILIKKTSRLIARHPAQIEVPPAPGLDGVAAQKIENWLYEWDQFMNQSWLLSLHNPYRYDQAFFLLLRGWLAHRTMLNPDYKAPKDSEAGYNRGQYEMWHHCLVDPANVYPFSNGYEVTRITHAWTCELQELRDDPLYDLPEEWDDRSDTTILSVRATYWKDSGSWWHAIVLGSSNPLSGGGGGTDWIKEPTELGYNPWTLTIANGAAYRQTDWDDVEYLEAVGTGLLDDAEDVFGYMARIATKLNELLSQESNPPYVLKAGQGEVKAIDLGPGGRNYIAEKDTLELLRVGPNLNDYMPLWEMLETRLHRATLPKQFYAEGGDASGFSNATLMAAGKDILYPFVECLNQSDALVYGKVLEIYRDYGPSKPLKTRLDPGQMSPQGTGGYGGGGFLPLTGLGEVLSAEITAQDIKAQGTYITVDRDDMTPQELATRVNLAIGLLREKVLSIDTIRKDWLKLKNPRAENLKVLAELVYLNEEVTKQLVGPALAQTGEDFIRRLWEIVQNPVPAPTPAGQMPMPQNMNGMPGGMPPGAPPAGPPGLPAPGPTGAPPGPVPQPPGLPSPAMPPIMGGNLLTNSNVQALDPAMAQFNALLGLLTGGGALGGGGAGGLPPMPNQGNPIPSFLPPGALLGGR